MATARARLWDVALDQYGYVTLHDAAELGIEDDTVRKLCARKELDRPAHGVYHFPQLPASTAIQSAPMDPLACPCLSG